VTLRRRPGGGRHEAWDVEGESGRHWFLRADAVEPGEHEHYTLRREAEIYRAVHSTGVPSPAVLGVHPTLPVVLLEQVAGEAGFAKLDTAAQVAIIDDFVPWLATLHATDATTLELPSLAPVKTIADHVRQELAIWESRLDATGVPDPFLSACFAWLGDHVPDTGDTMASLVQGDTGPGNFLHDGQRVTAFLDFELAHLGDPMEDLAWVGTRNAQEPVPDFEHLLALYAVSAGTEPDRDRIRYHMLFAELRIAVLGAERVSGEADVEAEHGNQLIYGALHRRLTVEALAAVTGTSLPDRELTEPADTPQTRYYDAMLHQIREIVSPHVADPYAARRLRSMARVVKYLREENRVGDAHGQAELDDLASLLGTRPSSIAAGSADLLQRVDDRSISAVDLLPYAYAQVIRRQQVVGPSMGVLATRHLPKI
jgi:aminoglycoside phosphotransferase (APT) family kinase protein